MDIKRMHDMVEKLSECAKCEFDKGIENIDACEMGEVTDMLKDLSEAMYYRTLTKAMNESDAEETMYMFNLLGDGRRFFDQYRYADGRFAPKGRGTRKGYTEPPYYHQMPQDYREWESMPEAERMRDLDRALFGRMFFTEPMHDDGMKADMRDVREGRAGANRRSYIETKEMHHGDSTADKDAKMKELEKYMKSLSEDVTELIAGMSPEEKDLTKRKLTALVTKM